MVKVDAGIDDANQYALTVVTSTTQNSIAIPDFTRANPLRASVGGQCVILVFQNFGDAGHAHQGFRFQHAQFDRHTVEDHVINIANINGTT